MALYADFNTKVTKDQLIARLDPGSLQSKVDQAQANLETARATAANAQAGIQKAQAGIQAASASVAALANVVKAGVATQDAKIKGDRRVRLAKEGVLSPRGRRYGGGDFSHGSRRSGCLHGPAARGGGQRESSVG
jgi:HlyD family secretion protein